MTSDRSSIMFVDDDMMLLASTRRQLLTKLNKFDLVFCSAGKQAILEASKRPPAIIFSDVRMPEMDGPELLKRFSESFPNTIRFALTGQSYEEQLDRTCAVAHQVFSKPFDTEKIRTIVENLMTFRSKLSFASIHSRLIKPLTDYPDLGNISEILYQLNAPEMSIDKVAEIIERDFTTKAHLLSIANSAFVSPAHPISSTRSAVMLLGSSLVKAIYLTVQASRIADSRVCAKNALQTSFDYGLKLSLAIQKLSLRKQLNSDLRECAIMSGMLQRFGRILFTLHGDDQYCQLGQQLRTNENELVEMEAKLFGVPQELVGAYVLLIWGMDPRVCLAIENVPDASPDVQSIQELLQQATAEVNR